MQDTEKPKTPMSIRGNGVAKREIVDLRLKIPRNVDDMEDIHIPDVYQAITEIADTKSDSDCSTGFKRTNNTVKITICLDDFDNKASVEKAIDRFKNELNLAVQGNTNCFTEESKGIGIVKKAYRLAATKVKKLSDNAQIWIVLNSQPPNLKSMTP